MPNDDHIKIFIAYSREDKDILNELRTNLAVLERTQDVDVWYDGEIEVGTNWEHEIKENLHSADLILLLISQNFIASDYSYNNEMMQALALHQSGKVKVVPVIARECLWQDTPFSVLQALPPDGKPITSNSWENPNRPYFLVANEVKDQVNRIRNTKKGIPNPPKQDIAIDHPVTPVNETIAKLQGGFFQRKGFKIGVPILLLAIFAIWFGPRLFSNNQKEDKTELAFAESIFEYYMDEGREYFFNDNFNYAKGLFEQALKTGEEFGLDIKEPMQFIKNCNEKLKKIEEEQSFADKNKKYNEWKVKGDEAYALKKYKEALKHYNHAKDFKETNYLKKQIKLCNDEIKRRGGSGTPGSFSLGTELLVNPKFQKSLEKTDINKYQIKKDSAAFNNVIKRIQ